MITNDPLLLEDDPDPANRLAYLCFTPGTRRDYMVDRFKERFGFYPYKIVEFKRMVGVGPVPKGEYVGRKDGNTTILDQIELLRMSPAQEPA